MSAEHTPPGPVTPPLDVGEGAGRDAATPRASAPGGGGAPAHPAGPFSAERRRRAVGWQSRDVIRTAALVMAMYVAGRMLWFTSTLVLTVFLAVLFGLAVSSGVDRLARFRIPRGVAAALIVVSFFGLLTAFGAWMAPTLREQGRVLQVRLPQAIEAIEEWVNERRSGLFGFLGGSQADSGAVAGQPGAARAPVPATGAGASAPQAQAPAAPGSTAAAQRSAEEVAAAARAGAQQVADSVDRRTADEPGPPTASETLAARLGGQLSGASRWLFPFLSSTLAVISGFFIVVFLSIYIAADPKLYHRGLMHLFPRKSRERAGEVLTAIATVLRKWLTTQLIAMVVIGTVTTIALMILDVKAAVALGVLAGLLEFVPTVGPIISAVPAIAMGFLDSPEKALTVTALYVGIQFAENQLLIPMLMKGGLDLPPAVTILAQALFTLLFGFLGLMVAVPAMAALMVAVKMLYVQDVVGDEVAVMEEDEEDG